MSSNIVKVVGNIFVFVFVLNKTFHTHLMLLFKLKKKKSHLYQRETGLCHERSQQTV